MVRYCSITNSYLAEISSWVYAFNGCAAISRKNILFEHSLADDGGTGGK